MTSPNEIGVKVRDLEPLQAFQWLQKGWMDFKQVPRIGLLHGLAVSGFGALLLLVAHDQFWLLAGAFTAFLAVAPVLAVGLYAVSRALEKNEPVSLMLVFQTWWSWRGHPHHDWRLVRFGLLLGLSGAGWVITSAALITLLSEQPVNHPEDFLRYVVAAPGQYLFEIWLLMGGLLAAPVFASTVVTLPLLLDRKIGILDAVLVSWKAVMQNPIPMALWAALLMMLALMGMLALVGSILVVPVLGHASWHAYRDSVVVDQLPLRTKE